MKANTLYKLYDIRQDIIDIYLKDDNKPTRRELNRLIKSLTRIIEKNY